MKHISFEISKKIIKKFIKLIVLMVIMPWQTLYYSYAKDGANNLPGNIDSNGIYLFYLHGVLSRSREQMPSAKILDDMNTMPFSTPLKVKASMLSARYGLVEPRKLAMQKKSADK
ncbi:hypothetical protein LWM68_06960 [Niabella sp. W65]|nr:hypothetical protein [Niabella sp. W65]MCH7362533.1 hypothetical protein [Niabella sp. W65]